MPFVPLHFKPLCYQCKTTFSTVWRRIQTRVACNECYIKHRIKELAQGNGRGKDSRANGRGKKKKGKTNAGSVKSQATKGRSRRVIFKKNPTRSALSNAAIVSGESVFHEGVYYQVGDVVSLVDKSDNIYYAQIQGLLQDLICEKSAIVTWLLPTQASQSNTFDPSTYVLGPEEDLPRPLDGMNFVCHAPHDYFRSRYSPYSVKPLREDKSFIWTSLTKAGDPSTQEVFGAKKR